MQTKLVVEPGDRRMFHQLSGRFKPNKDGDLNLNQDQQPLRNADQHVKAPVLLVDKVTDGL